MRTFARVVLATLLLALALVPIADADTILLSIDPGSRGEIAESGILRFSIRKSHRHCVGRAPRDRRPSGSRLAWSGGAGNQPRITPASSSACSYKPTASSSRQTRTL